MTSKRFLLSTLLALATVAVMIFASPFPLQASEGVPVDSFSLNFEPIQSTYPELEKTLIAERYDDHEIDRMLTLVEAYLVLARDTKLRPSFADFLRANGLRVYSEGGSFTPLVSWVYPVSTKSLFVASEDYRKAVEALVFAGTLDGFYHLNAATILLGHPTADVISQSARRSIDKNSSRFA